MENFLDADIQRMRDAERQFKRWRVLARFQRDDGLPGHAAGIRQRLLGHLAALEAQLADVVADRGVAHPPAVRRSRQYRPAATGWSDPAPRTRAQLNETETGRSRKEW